MSGLPPRSPLTSSNVLLRLLFGLRLGLLLPRLTGLDGGVLSLLRLGGDLSLETPTLRLGGGDRDRDRLLLLLGLLRPPYLRPPPR